MNNFSYIPLDQQVIDAYIKEFEESRKVVISKIRFDKGFENSVVALDFMDELLTWPETSKVNIHHVAFNVAYEYLENVIENLPDDGYKAVLDVVNQWSHAFKTAYDHSSSINFSWAFNELLKEVRPLIDLWSPDEDE